MPTREIECPDCGKRIPAGAQHCPRCASPLPGTMTLREAFTDPQFNPGRFDLRRLRWPHRALLILLVVGILICFSWLGEPIDDLPLDRESLFILACVLIAIGILVGIPAGMYVLVKWLLKRRARIFRREE
ncbi:MAG TPA: zinc ribbon domain-containing protein [Armatimonadota bacterium]|nr:zinc ribbon domain-containing protein [Armatimonadota bacterium]